MSCRWMVSFLVISVLLVSSGSPAQDLPDVDAVWIAEADGALRISAVDGTPLAEVTDLRQVRAAAVDLLAETAWLLSGGDLYRYDFLGHRQVVVELAAPDTHQVALVAHPTRGDVWAAVGNELWHVDATLEADAPQSLSGPVRGLAHEPESDTVWVATDRTLETLAPDAEVPVPVVVLPANAQVRALSIDTAGSRVWLALADEIRTYGLDGDETARFPVRDVEHLAAVSGGAWAATKKEVLRLSEDGTVEARAQPFGGQGKIVALVATWNRSVWTADPTDLARLTPDGAVAQRLTLEPPSRIWGLGHAADVFVPVLKILQPVSGSCTADATPAFVLSWSDLGAGVDPASLWAELDGSVLGTGWETTEGGATLQLSEALPEGPHQLVASVGDLAGNASLPAASGWTVDTVAPTFLELDPAEDVRTRQPTLVVSGRLDEPSTVELSLGGDLLELAVEADGSFVSPELPLSEGPNPISLVARDCAGNSTTVGFTVTVEDDDPGGLPPDPSVVAPPVDTDATTDVAESTAFLYEGPDPIQQDVTPGAVDAARVTVLRGRVLDRGGAPLPGARIEVHGEPDLGWTLSRADGTYDLAVNGGGQVVLSFQSPGRLPAQRRIPTPWRDWIAVDDVALVPLDPNATLISTGAPTSSGTAVTATAAASWETSRCTSACAISIP